MSGAKNASDLVPAGAIYGLGRNKSVELTIPGGAIGGPVSILRWHLAIRLINLDDPTPNSIPFTCMDIRSRLYAVLVIPRTTMRTLSSAMS